MSLMSFVIDANPQGQPEVYSVGFLSFLSNTDKANVPAREQ